MIYEKQGELYCECTCEDFIYLDNEMEEAEGNIYLIQCEECGETCLYDEVPDEDEYQHELDILHTDDFYRHNKHLL